VGSKKPLKKKRSHGRCCAQDAVGAAHCQPTRSTKTPI